MFLHLNYCEYATFGEGCNDYHHEKPETINSLCLSQR
jgi:hypothetical protein